MDNVRLMETVTAVELNDSGAIVALKGSCKAGDFQKKHYCPDCGIEEVSAGGEYCQYCYFWHD